MKTCSQCAVKKPFSEFYADKSKPDGRRPNCKLCASKISRAWREGNPEKCKAARKAFKKAHPEKDKVHTLAYRRRNAAKISATKRKYRLENREKAAAQHRAYCLTYPERIAGYSAARRARQKAVTVDQVTLREVIILYGNSCYICGIATDPRAPKGSPNKAELEHEIPLAKGGTHTLDNLRCACRPCNALKGAYRTAEETRELRL